MTHPDVRARLEQAISDPPNVHQAGSERGAPRDETLCYAVDPRVARFLLEVVAPGDRTLETGSGLSTLAFAMAGAEHRAVTPNGMEETRLRAYGAEKGIDLGAVSYVLETSDVYLPRCDLQDLAVVLLDGKHAFPWPMIDWFYTADRLRRGGLMLLDDAHMRPVGLLAEFLATETDRWQREPRIGRTEVFRKIADSALDMDWKMQPWTTAAERTPLGRLRAVPGLSAAVHAVKRRLG